MTQRPHDSRRLDVAALAAEGATLEGRWPLKEMPRLLASVDAAVTAEQEVTEASWRARGEQSAHGAPPRTWLHLFASATVTMACQRCLGPLAVPLEVDRRFGFVEGEARAAALDAEIEDDVLALDQGLDLRTLVEDELLLALPLVPRHDNCQPLAGAEPDAAEDAAVHPFAALEVLRRKSH